MGKGCSCQQLLSLSPVGLSGRVQLFISWVAGRKRRAGVRMVNFLLKHLFGDCKPPTMPTFSVSTSFLYHHVHPGDGAANLAASDPSSFTQNARESSTFQIY